MAHRRLFSNGISTERSVGLPSTGTNFSSYTLTNVGTNQAGNYSVEVVNGYGSLMSSNAVLTVEVFPPSHRASTVKSERDDGEQRPHSAYPSAARLHFIINGDSTAPTFLTRPMPFTRFRRLAQPTPETIPWS